MSIPEVMDRLDLPHNRFVYDRLRPFCLPITPGAGLRPSEVRDSDSPDLSDPALKKKESDRARERTLDRIIERALDRRGETDSETD